MTVFIWTAPSEGINWVQLRILSSTFLIYAHLLTCSTENLIASINISDVISPDFLIRSTSAADLINLKLSISLSIVLKV